MKLLTIVVHKESEQLLLKPVRELQQISGFTYSHAEGHGSHIQSDGFLQARDQLIGHSPRIRIDILADPESCQLVVERLKETEGLKGHAVYWITPVEESGHL